MTLAIFVLSIFNKKNSNTLIEPMFFGNSVNVARFDKQKFEIFEKLTEKQLSFFWRPEEIDVSIHRCYKLLYYLPLSTLDGFVQFPVKNPLSIYPFVVGAYP
jgi:hypothetical protein